MEQSFSLKTSVTFGRKKVIDLNIRNYFYKSEFQKNLLYYEPGLYIDMMEGAWGPELSSISSADLSWPCGQNNSGRWEDIVKTYWFFYKPLIGFRTLVGNLILYLVTYNAQSQPQKLLIPSFYKPWNQNYITLYSLTVSLLKMIKNVDLDIFLDINKDNDTFIREINYQQMRLDKNSERKTSRLLCLD